MKRWTEIPPGSGRVAGWTSEDGRRGAMMGVAVEGDLLVTSRDLDEGLERLLQHVAEREPRSVDELLAGHWMAGGTVRQSLGSLGRRLGASLRVTQVAAYRNESGQVAAYVHHGRKKGALVDVTTGAARASAEGPLKALCMHIVLFGPDALSRESLPADLVEREKASLREHLADKPADVQEKILARRLEKLYAERVLLEQAWILDDKTTVAKALGAALGAGTTVRAFACFRIGS